MNGNAAARRITRSDLAPDDLEPDTLRALIESFVLREGTDYGVHETSLEDKVAQVLIQLRRGEAHITFDPATESVNVVVTSATRRIRAALAARGETPAAFDGRGIPAGGVAPPSNTPGIRGRRALPAGRLARLGARRGFTRAARQRSTSWLGLRFHGRGCALASDFAWCSRSSRERLSTGASPSSPTGG